MKSRTNVCIFLIFAVFFAQTTFSVAVDSENHQATSSHLRSHSAGVTHQTETAHSQSSSNQGSTQETAGVHHTTTTTHSGPSTSTSSSSSSSSSSGGLEITGMSDSIYTIKSKTYRSWIQKASRAETWTQYHEALESFEILVTKFKKKFPTCVPPPPPTFHQIYENKFAMACENGYRSGVSKGQRYASRFFSSKKQQFSLSYLLKSIPMSSNSIFSMCRIQGAKEGFKKRRMQLEVGGGKSASSESIAEEAVFEKKMMEERMRYYEYIEELVE